jgi:hypothetical protein
MEIMGMKVAVTKWSEEVSDQEDNSQILDDNEILLSRKKRARELLRTDNMAGSNKKSIRDICENFHDIF